MLDNYNPAENNPGKRRDVLARAIQIQGVSTVKRSLEVRKGKAQGYRVDRIRSDLNWLKKKYGGRKSRGLPFI